MIDKPLLAAVIALLTFSLMMSYSLSTYTVIHFHYSDFHFFLRQFIAIFIALLTMVTISKINPDKWFVPMSMVLFVTFFLLMIFMQFLPASLVKAVGGAKRWIHLGPISIAPVEFFKIGFVFFLSWSLARKFQNKNKMSFIEEVKAFSPYVVLFLIIVVLIAIFQKDLGQVVVLGATLVVLFLLVGSSYKFFLTLVAGALSAFVALIFAAPHRIARIKSWWSTVQDNILSLLPFEGVENLRVDAAKEPYQISNSLNAIHNGGFFGQGLGNGQFKLGYLSEVHTDFILAGITEEFGFLGLALVSFAIFFIIYRIFKIAAKVEEPIYYLFCVGVGLLIAFAFLLNSFGISGITPIKGIAVPFLSYGGSHIMAAGLAIGMVLMISKKVPRDAQGRML
ncbi:putative peptidoglycan glycosyltransferase FtsW [Sulfurovum sp. zt1-1]|uniref:Probable peptidoglycan glycosyltransferase FtsW n=1 Tax=Sulfurovum zhangzhouensis TaxID=3019067 RepID=A0ABT7QZK5_9BACT|nr:putative peptidoglycan glycosyltransferase FtsW [Sulfurovum zhangzhouensis]MDM5272233.1 putative peptidoglycan glycosyltransferase FtsW [Sulfurovum zhangzhouensis]